MSSRRDRKVLEANGNFDSHSAHKASTPLMKKSVPYLEKIRPSTEAK